MSTTPRATIEAGLAALAARDPARAAALLREGAGAVPPADMPWLALANAELALANNDAAEAAIDQQLALTPREVGALLLKALLRERSGDPRAASSFYQTALNQAAIGGEVPAELAALEAHARRFIAGSNAEFEAHLRGQLGTDLSPAIAEAIDLLTGRRQLYLQQPSVFYYPGLAQQRFFDPAQFAWLAPMLALLPQMQRELAAVLAGEDSGFTPYVEQALHRPAPNNPLLGSQAWGAFHFWRNGEVVAGNAARCPATMAALSHAPLPQIPGRSPNAHWSRLLPGAHIAPHHGMLNTRLICHIPVLTAPGCTLRVGNETREWHDGVPLIFDDSIEHEARNAGSAQRVVLLFEVWRPAIDEADRAAIGRIFESIGAYGT